MPLPAAAAGRGRMRRSARPSTRRAAARSARTASPAGAPTALRCQRRRRRRSATARKSWRRSGKRRAWRRKPRQQALGTLGALGTAPAQPLQARLPARLHPMSRWRRAQNLPLPRQTRPPAHRPPPPPQPARPTSIQTAGGSVAAPRQRQPPRLGYRTTTAPQAPPAGIRQCTSPQDGRRASSPQRAAAGTRTPLRARSPGRLRKAAACVFRRRWQPRPMAAALAAHRRQRRQQRRPRRRQQPLALRQRLVRSR